VAFVALAAASAGRLAGAFDADRMTRGAILLFAIVVTIGLGLGASHLITVPAYLVAQAVLLALTVTVVRRRATAAREDAGSAPAIAVGCWVAIVAFVIGMGLSNSPFTAYDAVSYHLFFPARWLQAHRLAIIPTPFSDEAQAYQPANGELWFLWLMLPLHSDALARIGQVPFYVLGAIVSNLLALRCGASRAHAAYAPTFFLIAPPIVEQAVGANVDLIAAVMFVSALWLSLVAIDSDRRRDWVLWGVASGLFVGTKYLAVVYLPVLIGVTLLRGIRLRALWGIPGIVALSLPWYLRNWIVAGSPLYPATFTIAGVTIGRGAYTHAAMLQSFMHTTEPRLLGVSLVHAFGAPFFLSVAPIVFLAVVAIVARRLWWPASALVVAIAGVVALCWVTVGDNTDARFLLPAVAAVPALIPLAFGANRRRNLALHTWVVAGIVWVLVGVDRQIDLALPWFMADWLPLHGVLDPRFVIVFGGLTALAAIVCAIAARFRLLTVSAVTLTVTAGVTLAVGAEHWCQAGRCEYVQIDSPHIRLTYLYGARWLDANVRGANVAYAGINLPYPLSGSDLTNTVSYVNIDNHLTWRFDQYAAAYQRGALSSPAEPLAKPSGVLMPASGPDAIRPRFERRAGDREEWKMNLKRDRIGYLFVAKLDPYEIEYSWRDAEGFPIENEWAKSDPQSFRLVYSNDTVRIYEIDLR